MGKKSKAAKAKGKAGTANAPASSGAGIDAVGGAPGGSKMTSKKAQKCVRCFGTVKTDKGISCPGCSQLYCWRCEKKAFDFCPNGTNCAHPIRRCLNCAHGATFIDVMKKREGFICPDSADYRPETIDYVNRALVRFTDEVIPQDDALSGDARPTRKCEGCDFHECLPCTSNPKSGRIYTCRRCRCALCIVCAEKKFRAMKFDDVGTSLASRWARKQELQIESLSLEDVREFFEFFRKFSGDAVIRCHTPGCMLTSCISCMDDLSMASMIISGLSHHRYLGKTGEILPIQCSRCYWTTKPCTNPTCPNEVGVPTKRCGGCHLDRYCSVECQMAAYPAHLNRCNKIRERRAAALEKNGD